MRSKFLIAILLLPAAMAAQRYVFAQWGAENGLPNATINAIAEDPLGFLWLATDGAGLVRFDDGSFSQPVLPDSLPSPFVTALVADASGSFWLGTERGPCFYNGSALTKFKLPADLQTRVNGIAVHPDGTVYFATRSGLYQFDNESFSIVDETVGKEIFSLAMATEPLGEPALLYSATDGLHQIGGALLDTIVNHQQINRVISVKGDVLLVGKMGVYSLKMRTFITTQSSARAAAMLGNQYWISGSNEGVEVIDAKGILHIDAESGLDFSRVRCVYLAKNGTLWLGSQRGLSQLKNRYLQWFTTNSGLVDTRVHALLHSTDGTIWVGTASGLFGLKQGQTKGYTVAQGVPPGIVLALEEDAQGEIWVGTEGGVARQVANRFEPIEAENEFTFCLKFFNGHMYVGGAQGLKKAVGNRLVTVPDGDLGIVKMVVHRGVLYALSITGEILRVSEREAVEVDKFADIQVDTMVIRDLASDEDGMMTWVTEQNEVWVYTGETCMRIGRAWPMENQSIKAIAAHNNKIYLAEDDGIWWVDIASKNRDVLQYFGAESGFLAKKVNDRCLQITQKGTLLVGTNSGLFHIDQRAFEREPETPVFITSVDLFFNPQTKWLQTQPNQAWLSAPQALRLPADKNYLTFHFAAPQATQHSGYFRYILSGQDIDYTSVAGRQEAIYTDINPGTYTFEVQRSNSPDFKAFTSAAMTVVIVPPYYKTWWFWLAIVALLGAMLYALVRYRINQLNARLALETALAESERKALRLQMNPHFVFNALDAISGFIFKNEPKEAVRYLTSFAKLMRLTLESSRETLVPLQNEIQLLKNYVALEQVRFNMNFEYKIEVDEALDEYEAMLPPMLLQPLVENAILHGLRNRETTGGFLRISFQRTENQLIAIVEDNGVGRAKSAEISAKRGKKSLATSITAERIALLSKSLGQKVTFQIIDLFHPDNSPSGTRVVISLPYLVNDMDS